MNLFMKLHTTKVGTSKPIVSMSDDHLLNTIKLFLVKIPQKAMEELRARELQNYAPEGMDNLVRRRLRLKVLTEEVKQEVEQNLEEQDNAIFEEALERALPYLIVGICRDSTANEVRQILIDTTGLTTQVDLPQFTSYATMTQQEVLELTGGNPLHQILENDWDTGGLDEDPDEGDR